MIKQRRKAPLKKVVAFLLMGGAMAGGALADPATIEHSPAQKAATDITNKWATAYNADQPSAIADLFSQDGVYLTPGGTKLVEHRTISKAIESRIKAGWTNETVTVLDAHPAGDDVWLYGTFEIKGAGDNQGKAIGGYYTEVMTKEGSDWRILLLIANLKPTRDVTGMAAAAQSK